MCEPRDDWTPTAEPWWQYDPIRRAAKAVAPTTDLTVAEDRAPVAGRILGPHGELLRVVRHGPPPTPFGFTRNGDTRDGT